ncbi:hypothetical protein APSETT444_009151 [Aspergillus pseudonomiae]
MGHDHSDVSNTSTKSLSSESDVYPLHNETTAPATPTLDSISEKSMEASNHHHTATHNPDSQTSSLDSGSSSRSRATLSLHESVAAENEAILQDSGPSESNDNCANAGNLEHVGTPVNYNLINNPPNLARIRQVMFECKDPIEISLEEFETYWPYIDNVWVKQRSNSSKEGHCTTDYYMCRLRRPTHRTSETRPLPEGKRPRKKRVREGGICNFQIKVVRFEGAYSTVTIARTPGSSPIHSHDLDYIDRVKRNSGLMEFARKEAIKGYLPSSIYTKFQEEPEKLIEAGGKFCTVTDVRNVSAKWRIQNPEVKLIPHDGMLRTAVEGKGKAPWVVVSPGAQIHPQKLMMLKGYGGDFLRIVEYNQNWRLRWEAILRALASEGVKSVMIEGGGTVLSELLNPEYTEFIDSIIVTVAPTYLGSGGVPVSPDSKRDEQGKPNAALNPREVKWMPLGQNVIMCGRIRDPD